MKYLLDYIYVLKLHPLYGNIWCLKNVRKTHISLSYRELFQKKQVFAALCLYNIQRENPVKKSIYVDIKFVSETAEGHTFFLTCNYKN